MPNNDVDVDVDGDIDDSPRIPLALHIDEIHFEVAHRISITKLEHRNASDGLKLLLFRVCAFHVSTFPLGLD